MSSPCTSLPTALSDASELRSQIAQLLFESIKGSSTKLQLDDAMKATIQANVAHQIDDDEHNYLVNCIVVRRSKRGARPLLSFRGQGRSCSRFPARCRQSSPDRQKSRERRRTLGGSSVLPPSLRAQYTEGHRAVLCVVALEIKKKDFCDFAIDKIAALAGVCRTTVYYALKMAGNLGHVSVTERRRPPYKNLTNIVRIISAEWRTWILRGLDGHGTTAFKTSKMVSPTKNKDSLEGRLRWNCAQTAHTKGLGSSPISLSSVSGISASGLQSHYRPSLETPPGNPPVSTPNQFGRHVELMKYDNFLGEHKARMATAFIFGVSALLQNDVPVLPIIQSVLR